MQEHAEKDEKSTSVGIIIPCYNHGKYVSKALNSVVQQSYKNKCIYISNEKSTDNSKEVILSNIKELEKVKENLYFGKIENCPVVFYDNPEPKGPSAARNNLIKIGIQNDAFSMLDADDYYLPNKLNKTVEIMNSNPMIGLVYNDAIIHNVKLNTNIYEYREPFSAQRLHQECIVSNTPLIRKQALIDCGLYDEDMRTAEDWDLWIRITKRYIAYHIPEALHVYRVTGENASDVVPMEVWQKNWQKIRERLNERS